MIAETKKIPPKDLQPGMFAKFHVKDVGYSQDYLQFCEVVEVRKIQRPNQNSPQQYAIWILEPPTPTRATSHKSRRIVSTRDKLEVRA